MTIKFPEKFLDDQLTIRHELLDEDAGIIAEALKESGVSTHQVRKFFDEVKRFRTRLEKGESYNTLKPLIIMLKSKAKYAVNTKKTGMQVFYEFIEESINLIKNSGDEKTEVANFKAFCLFFEAVYGFADLKNS